MQNTVNSSLSVILIFGWLLKKLPIVFVQKFLTYAINSMHTKHPKVFAKLTNDNLTFTIDVIDLPFNFYLDPSKPTLTAYYKNQEPTSSAKIKGKLVDLLMLFEGEKDGDAMFFSKELVIEGSTAAIVHLRNTIDGEDMNIVEDLAGEKEGLKAIIKLALKTAVTSHNTIQQVLDNITSAVNYNPNQNHKATQDKLDDIYEEIDNFKQFIYEYKKQQIRRKSDYQQKSQEQQPEEK